MNEEQAVLEFFSKVENLPLGLSVAEQMDDIRKQMNNRLWRELLQRIKSLGTAHGLEWQVELTEDNNTPNSLVGLHCTINTGQPLYLRPMVEQQYMGGVWRIYFGLMWSAPPPDQSGLHEINSLKATLQQAGFKSNENFLSWQWTALYPRRKDFLLRYAHQPEKLLEEIEAMLKTLLIDHRKAIEQANTALEKTAQRSLTASLDQLRDELID